MDNDELIQLRHEKENNTYFKRLAELYTRINYLENILNTNNIDYNGKFKCEEKGETSEY